jgi:hypothetical protein
MPSAASRSERIILSFVLLLAGKLLPKNSIRFSPGEQLSFRAIPAAKDSFLIWPRTAATTALGQSRHFGRRPITSGPLLETDIVRAGRHVSKVPEPDLICPCIKGAMRHEPPDYSGFRLAYGRRLRCLLKAHSRVGADAPEHDLVPVMASRGFVPAHGSRDARYVTIARRSCSSRLATTWAINGLHSPVRAPCWKS